MSYGRKPTYRLIHDPPHPTRSKLTIDTAYPIYEKVGQMMAIRVNVIAPGLYKGEPALFQQRRPAWYRPIRWMPELENGWRRMSFAEFIEYYGIGGEAV